MENTNLPMLNLFQAKKIFTSKIYFPNYIELYCNLDIQKNEKNLKRILKAYWKNFPHNNILDFVLKNFANLNILEKVKILINILEGHNNLYLKYLLLGEIKAKAKGWAESKKDLLNSHKNLLEVRKITH